MHGACGPGAALTLEQKVAFIEELIELTHASKCDRLLFDALYEPTKRYFNGEISAEQAVEEAKKASALQNIEET